MRNQFLILASFLLAACAVTGGDLIRQGQQSISPGKAVVVISVEVPSGARFESCSIFVGKSPATARWFGWNVQDGTSSLFSIEVDAGEYGLHRFGCSYRGLPLSTSAPGPSIELSSGEVRYLGRLAVSDIEYGTAARYSRMPTSIALTFRNTSEEDLEELKHRAPIFRDRDVTLDIPDAWGDSARYAFRPYKQGTEVVVSPVM